MTDRSQLVKKALGETRLGDQPYMIYFQNMTDNVFGASQVLSIAAAFESHILYGGSDLVRWNNLSFDTTNGDQGGVYVFVRYADSEEAIASARWDGPYYESPVPLSTILSRYIQFKFVFEANLLSFLTNPPRIDKAIMSGFGGGTPTVFYLDILDLGFIPKRMVLTYNALNQSDDTIIQFSVAGTDTLDPTKYFVLKDNEMNELTKLPALSQKLKVAMRAVGKAGDEFSVDEFAFVISGTDKTQLNIGHT